MYFSLCVLIILCVNTMHINVGLKGTAIKKVTNQSRGFVVIWDQNGLQETIRPYGSGSRELKRDRRDLEIKGDGKGEIISFSDDVKRKRTDIYWFFVDQDEKTIVIISFSKIALLNKHALNHQK